MSTQLATGIPTLNLDLLFGYASKMTIFFDFFNADDTDYNLTDTFKLQVFNSKNSITPIFELLESGTLVRAGNRITAPFTVSNTTHEKEFCYWRLRNVTTDQDWYVGNARFNKGPVPNSDYSVTQTMNIGEQIIQGTVITGFDIASLTNAQKQALATALSPYFLG